eukprot:scaffold63883_cov61-Phaeocystis_antarctica.AAC.2
MPLADCSPKSLSGWKALRVGDESRFGVVEQPGRKPTPVSLPVPAVVVCQKRSSSGIAPMAVSFVCCNICICVVSTPCVIPSDTANGVRVRVYWLVFAVL